MLHSFINLQVHMCHLSYSEEVKIICETCFPSYFGENWECCRVLWHDKKTMCYVKFEAGFIEPTYFLFWVEYFSDFHPILC